ncbi:cysteine hydrolase family protein [Penicillium alfredii]|uniref:Cysteine hydrolase family protein n=1 Tax=Penicillium alfredii TaxID=1506179 RepID=A0A9W9F311_9EURO|nr:cysteine hydrolase family protein [Penicillium alfredii]KAJ5092546.1 cysteine hydrolase family protein [Penicillium alfredii]
MGSTQEPVNFGQHYAILNLDWICLLINAIEETPEGKSMIASCSIWNDAVHSKSKRPLTIFTTLAFNRGQLELEANKPFARLIAPFGSFEDGSPGVKIDSRFMVDEKDVVLRKTRWSATTGNNLEQILKAQGIDTVVISGLSLSGVVMATIYRLFDLDFNIYVIRDNVVELPVDQDEAFSKVMLEALIPKMNLRVISLDEAIQALGHR